MKREFSRIYVKSTHESYETLFSGIKFVDFMECVSAIENIMVLKGDYWSGKYWKRFALVEGKGQIDKLCGENVHNYGDFCFVDYVSPAVIDTISNEEAAQLLYLSHMFEPLSSPFFDVLQNEYAYLAHDDGWYCKLYCRNRQFPITVAVNKLQKNARNALGDNALPLPENLIEAIHKQSEKGLLIEMEVVSRKKGVLGKKKVAESASIKLYEVGKYENMDSLLNNIEQNQTKKILHVDLL